VSKAAKGMISPRGEKGGNDADNQMTQGEVFQLK
jgi:hypothetical protein